MLSGRKTSTSDVLMAQDVRAFLQRACSHWKIHSNCRDFSSSRRRRLFVVVGPDTSRPEGWPQQKRNLRDHTHVIHHISSPLAFIHFLPFLTLTPTVGPLPFRPLAGPFHPPFLSDHVISPGGRRSTPPSATQQQQEEQHTELMQERLTPTINAGDKSCLAYQLSSPRALKFHDFNW